jgi:hypothetical protein
MKKLLLALIACLSCSLPAMAQTGTLPLGFPQDTFGVPNAAAQYLVLVDDPSLSSDRIFSPTARFTITNNGAHGTYVLELATVTTGFGGTGATTAQGGFNNLAAGTAGSALASQDILYYNGSNWTVAAK